jgi:RNA polymerase sigma-70 factor (ECF subfamily)
MNDHAFAELVTPHRAALRLHCYRMLGSSHDGDDMVQETLVRAWRAHEALQDLGAARSWLYRIATNVCLDELARRPKRESERVREPAPADAERASGEEWWVEPCPSAWLDGVTDNPGANVELRESIALAFVVALQVLTPPQRAVLLLFRSDIGPRIQRIGARLLRCDANGQTAFAFYRGGALVAVHVVTARGGRIVAMDQFFLPKIFPVFGLALSLETELERRAP